MLRAKAGLGRAELVPLRRRGTSASPPPLRRALPCLIPRACVALAMQRNSIEISFGQKLPSCGGIRRKGGGLGGEGEKKKF